MLWLFPQVLLQGVIIAIGIVYSCDTETRWLFVADGDLLVLQQLVDQYSKMLILNNVLQPIWDVLYNGEYVRYPN